MSKTTYVCYRDRSFAAYDVALSILLKHLIDVSEPVAISLGQPWLTEAIRDWRVWAAISDFGFTINEKWSEAEIKTLCDLLAHACRYLAQRDSIPATEIEGWSKLDEMRIFTRGEKELATAPIIELGNAIIALADGSLPEAPAQFNWHFGSNLGQTLIEMRGLS